MNKKFTVSIIATSAFALLILGGCQQNQQPVAPTPTSEVTQETQPSKELTLTESSEEKESNLDNALKELDLVE